MTWESFLSEIKKKDFLVHSGRLTKVSSLIVEAKGIGGFVGELCKIKNPAGKDGLAEIVGLKEDSTLLMPYGELRGINLDSSVSPTGTVATVPIGEGLLGRVIDPFGKPLDSHRWEDDEGKVPIRGSSHNPLNRKKISDIFETGVRAIDAFLPIGKGQRIGIFAGSGVGKSTLLGMIARHSKSDVNVIALIGERGREVGDFLDEVLGEEGLARSIVVVATADQPALIREIAAHTATAIAEYFCAKNKDVLLIMDSVTRFAMARREIGLSIGEPATARGYTPSAFGELPKLIERAGNFQGQGSITGIYTVLVEGDDLHEPVSDHMRAILDGHIVLSRELATHGHYPAIDILASISRLSNDLWSKDEKVLIKRILRALSVRSRHIDMIEIGAYKAGTNKDIDEALVLYPELEKFLMQTADDIPSRTEVFQELNNLARVLS